MIKQFGDLTAICSIHNELIKVILTHTIIEIIDYFIIIIIIIIDLHMWAQNKMADVESGFVSIIKTKNTKRCVWQEFGLRATEDGKILETECTAK